MVGFALVLTGNGGRVYRNEAFNAGNLTELKLLSTFNSTNTQLSLDNITEWDKGLYQGVNLKEGREFGIDFSIDKTSGYFIRESGGVITP